MKARLTTRNATEYELLGRFRTIDEKGRKALLLWARALHRLFLAPPLPKLRRPRTRKGITR